MVDYVLPTTAYGSIASILQEAAELHIPSFCDIEVASAFRSALLSRKITESHAAEAVRDYSALPLTRHGHRDLIARILELRDNFSAYDATYVALAEQLDATLFTADGKLYRAVKRHLSLRVLSPGQGN